MAVFLGFDPGGVEQFGWCVAVAQDHLPLTIRRAGIVNYAGVAVQEALSCVNEGEEVLAAAIDAPMFWIPEGDRQADQALRQAIQNLGAPHPWGTVQPVNSLRGACLAQGMSTALLLRERYPEIPITETHPKAMLWLLDYATPLCPTPGVKLSDIRQLAGEAAYSSEHQRDAAVAVLSAWASKMSPPGWQDLLVDEGDHIGPVGKPLSYWMPDLRKYVAQHRAPADSNRKKRGSTAEL